MVDKRLLALSRHDPFQFNSYPCFEGALSVAAATPRTLALKNERDLKMKCLQIPFVMTVLFLAGCEYEFPLTKEHTISIDASVLGLWEPVPEKGEEPDPDERMMILKYSDTQYLIHHPMGRGGLYFRGYPIKIGNVSCVQVEIIGDEDGPLPKDAKEVFYVVSYVVANGELEVKSLNTKLVSDKLRNSEAMRRAFLEHQGNKDLFTDPAKFRRIKANQPDAGDGK